MNRALLKLFAWAIALALIGLPIVGVLNGWFAQDRWPIRNLQVEAEFNHVGADQIRAATKKYLGTGFFAIRLDDLRGAVAALPWVERVEVRKHWPDTIEMRVLEQQPFARWGDKRLIGRSGQLFQAPGTETIQGLPQLSGPDENLAEVVDFYQKTLTTLSGSGLALAGVSLSPRGSWTINLVDGSEIALGQGDVDAHLRRFLDVFPRLAVGRGTTVFARADLRYANGFSIRWLAAAPATESKPPTAAGADNAPLAPAHASGSTQSTATPRLSAFHTPPFAPVEDNT